MDEKIVSQYLATGKKVEITLPDGTKGELILKPLGMKALPRLFKMFENFKGSKEEEIGEHMTEETITDIIEIVYDTLKKSYPEISEEAIEEITSQNAIELFPEIIELNAGTVTDRNKMVQDRLKKLRDVKANTTEKASPVKTTN